MASLHSLLGNIQKPIALDPGRGGHSIGGDVLNSADIIVSTTSARVSGLIRVGTRSVVSHAALYAGSGSVIEAIGTGVTVRSIDDSLSEDVLAVAYRSPHITSTIARAVIQYASAQIGKPYSVTAAGRSALPPLLCKVEGDTPAAFFCSQLVIEAYKRAGLPLTNMPAECVTPDGLATIAKQRLIYVGHLKGNTSWFPVLSP